MYIKLLYFETDISTVYKLMQNKIKTYLTIICGEKTRLVCLPGAVHERILS